MEQTHEVGTDAESRVRPAEPHSQPEAGGKGRIDLVVDGHVGTGAAGDVEHELHPVAADDLAQSQFGAGIGAQIGRCDGGLFRVAVRQPQRAGDCCLLRR
jgi:hypothetical protein